MTSQPSPEGNGGDKTPLHTRRTGRADDCCSRKRAWRDLSAVTSIAELKVLAGLESSPTLVLALVDVGELGRGKLEILALADVG